MATRQQNEREFPNWEELPTGGRRYWRDREGIDGFQRMIKTVDAGEKTLQVVQEIYNGKGELVERHQKYPFDSGHQVIKKQD
ncbi:MAG: hypothetical protein JXB47_04510 [Anaerolineae bacterium]|nr:hypothetical protein [Anaerolineae bacterium]